MGIQIKSIKYTNYRQYGTQTIVLDGGKGNNLSVFIAKNGTGKTTLLNSITWCLYAKEMFIGKENEALPLLNTAVLENSNPGATIIVNVSVQIEDEENIINFNRSLPFRIVKTSAGGKKAIPSNDAFEVVVQKKLGVFNTTIKTGAEADMAVKQYFDFDIYDFYFFDGEQLKVFFDTTRAEAIKASIYNISQVALLEKTIGHLTAVSKETKRKIAKTNPDYEAVLTQKEAVESIIEKLKEEISTYKNENIENQKKKESLEDILRGVAPIKQLQEERESREEELNQIDIEEKEYKEEKNSFLRKYMILLNMYPYISKTLKLIERKESSGELPPQIDRNLVQNLLDHIDDRCPVCDQEIGDTAREHLQKLLDDLSVSSATSNYLKEIKAPLEQFVEDAGEYKTRRAKMLHRQQSLKGRREACEKRLDEIGQQIGNYESNTYNKIDIPKTEKELREINDKIQANIQSIATNGAQLEIKEKEHGQLAKRLEEEKAKAKSIDQLSKEDGVLDALLDAFNSMLEDITSDMRKQIEEITWSIFDKMIWKSNTFGRVSIDETYQVKVFDKSDHVMTGSLSATEQMALAYAFTLAVHQASGKNCPLVIDSPLGRVSDENRENMAKALYEVSKDKQIVMLFTPDEYSREVREQYEGVITPVNLSLSEDESHIKEVFANG